jgi:putative tryptophan/tyrosine transport system substrate-binding protein
MRYILGCGLAFLIARKQLVGRRAVLIGLVTALLPSSVNAQKSPMLSRMGWLSAGSDPDPFLEGFREGLRKLGYVEGQNIILEIRHAHGDVEALRAGAAEREGERCP